MSKSHIASFGLLALLILGQIQAATSRAQVDPPEPVLSDPVQPKKRPTGTAEKARPSPLPKGFAELDADGDGQVGLDEWRAAKRPPAGFTEYDLNGDGYITPQELARYAGARPALALEKNQLAHAGAIAAVDETYRGKVAYTVLRVRLEAGKTYDFALHSGAYQPFLYLEDGDAHPLTENSAAGVGEVCRLTYRAGYTGTYRLVVTSAAGVRVGPFHLTVRSQDRANTLPKWFRDLDADGDGQLGLDEWRAAGRPLAGFAEYDTDGDGFITPLEFARRAAEKAELKFANGKATYSGAMGEDNPPYRGRTAYRVVTVQLDANRLYRFEMTSPAFQSLLTLETETGAPLAERASPAVGGTCGLKFRPPESGTFRVVVTSVGGVKSGPFALSARVEERADSLPPWFKDLDTNADGQVGLDEWIAGARSLADFRELDTDGDGFVTRRECLRHAGAKPDLVLDAGRLTHSGAVEEDFDGHRNRTAFKVLTIRLEVGRTYQFDLSSQAFQAQVLLEDADGELIAEGRGRGIGDSCRLVHRASHTGTHRVVATSVGGVRPGPFKLTVREGTPSALPAWFEALDTDGDGQVGLDEWRAAGRPLDSFRTHDLNDDGLITPQELARRQPQKAELVLDKGKGTFAGAVEENAENYRGKTAYRVVTARLEAGRVYQLTLNSPAFQSFLYLEDDEKAPLAEHSSPVIGGTAQLVFRAPRGGTYRVVVTSLGGFRVGPFNLTATHLQPASTAPRWFRDLDTNADGQVGVDEWIAGARPLAEFTEYDTNGDGFVTPAEVARRALARPDLRLEKGKLAHTDAVATVGEPHRGKAAFKTLTVRLEAGKTYELTLTSTAFQSFLYIEDADGVPLAESGAPGIGSVCTLKYRPPATATYRLVLTSVGGFRTGPCTLAVREGPPPPGLPLWFEALDADNDGQVSLDEWRVGGKPLAQFAEYDLNGDGFVTPQEARRATKN